MNHTYKTLYNTALGAWVAVPEIARNRGKSPRNYRHASSAFSFAFARTALASALLLQEGRHWLPFLRVRRSGQRILPLAPALLLTQKFLEAMAARQSVPMPKPLRGMMWPLVTVQAPKVAAAPTLAKTGSG